MEIWKRSESTTIKIIPSVFYCLSRTTAFDFINTQTRDFCHDQVYYHLFHHLFFSGECPLIQIRIFTNDTSVDKNELRQTWFINFREDWRPSKFMDDTWIDFAKTSRKKNGSKWQFKRHVRACEIKQAVGPFCLFQLFSFGGVK